MPRDRSIQGLNPGGDRTPDLPPPVRRPALPSPPRPQLVPAPDPAGVEEPDPQREPAVNGEAMTAVPSAGRKRKVAVSVPQRVYDRLRHHAEATNAWMTDVVLRCLDQQRDRLTAEHGTGPSGGLSRPPRKANRGQRSTQLFLYMTTHELEQVDQIAADLGLSRSRLIAEAVDAELADEPPAG